MEKDGIGSIGDVSLVTELATSEDFMKAERVKGGAVLARGGSSGWRNQGEVRWVVMDEG